MAKLRGPGHSDSARGAFNNSMIFRMTKRGAVLTGYHKPGSAHDVVASEAQLARREMYRAGLDYWALLSTVEKAVWTALAKSKALTGFNLFISAWLFGKIVFSSELLSQNFEPLLTQDFNGFLL